LKRNVRCKKNAVFWHVCGTDLVRIDVSEERSATINKVIRIGELGTTIALTSNRLMITNHLTNSVELSTTPEPISYVVT
jgi:hypothetical protein